MASEDEARGIGLNWAGSRLEIVHNSVVDFAWRVGWSIGERVEGGTEMGEQREKGFDEGGRRREGWCEGGKVSRKGRDLGWLKEKKQKKKRVDETAF